MIVSEAIKGVFENFDYDVSLNLLSGSLLVDEETNAYDLSKAVKITKAWMEFHAYKYWVYV